MMEALGMVETRGLVAAIEAADIASLQTITTFLHFLSVLVIPVNATSCTISARRCV